ncbi:hypothetical protein CR513_36630, partial [Mucuna pruriens]
MNLERHYGQPIGYESSTYGQLHNIIVETDIQNQLELLVLVIRKAQSRKDFSINLTNNIGRRHIKIKELIIKIKILLQKIRKKLIKNKKYENIKREVKCWKCGKEHYTNKHRVIHKINQLEDEILKKNLLNILINSDHEEISSEELEDFEDNLKLEQIEMISTSSFEEEEKDDNY